ncbi:hypothetical protein CASP1_00014 [Alcaligenes phage CASP1]|nr:hypothetical protein CASP1_00014 [Alcaligenes phage CASP1]
MTTPSELMALCCELNKDDFNVQFSFMGHVNSFSLHIYPGGYDILDYVEFDSIFSKDQIPEAIEWLTEQHDKYRSTQNEVDGK